MAIIRWKMTFLGPLCVCLVAHSLSVELYVLSQCLLITTKQHLLHRRFFNHSKPHVLLLITSSLNFFTWPISSNVYSSSLLSKQVVMITWMASMRNQTTSLLHFQYFKCNIRHITYIRKIESQAYCTSLPFSFSYLKTVNLSPKQTRYIESLL